MPAPIISSYYALLKRAGKQIRRGKSKNKKRTGESFSRPFLQSYKDQQCCYAKKSPGDFADQSLSEAAKS
jgi:hypothetical protein